ncbi:hypothetical protein [Cryobacterium sp. GrIS_2_6]|uniref:hypothetical protein n=1 Tax=Cryobacterium sp. GrIS_2_6 TaxID=3162785 RepID=UPI002E05E82C|nr:hypothetical protein [Cryobacterium psychrotolerans]
MGQSVESGGFADLKGVQISATEWRVSKRFLEERDPSVLTTLKVTTARIAGGTDVVSAGIENALKVVPGVTTVKRNSGADRYATAVAINFDAFATSSTATRWPGRPSRAGRTRRCT